MPRNSKCLSHFLALCVCLCHSLSFCFIPQDRCFLPFFLWQTDSSSGGPITPDIHTCVISFLGNGEAGPAVLLTTYGEHWTSEFILCDAVTPMALGLPCWLDGTKDQTGDIQARIFRKQEEYPPTTRVSLETDPSPAVCSDETSHRAPLIVLLWGLGITISKLLAAETEIIKASV